MSSLINHFYSFEDFVVDVDQRVLLRGGKPVALTPKVFDTLLILLESRGKIVEKDELRKRLWPDTFVEEANIAFNIQQLRKCLGDDARDPRFVETVARRGYRFIADVEHLAEETDQREVVETPSSNISTIPATHSKRRGSSYLAVGMLSVVVLGIAGVSVWKFGRRAVTTVTEKGIGGSSVSKTAVKLEQLTATGQSFHVAISPDSKYVAYERVLENRAGVWVRQLAANTNVELVPPSGSVYGLAFNKSSDYVYFVRGKPATALYRVSLLGGPPVKLIDLLEGNFSLRPEDDQIAFIRIRINPAGQREYFLMTARSDGSDERQVLSSVHPFGLDTPLWSPDGKSILCSYGNTTGGSQDVGLIEVNIADGKKKELSDIKFFRITKMAWLPNGSALLLSATTNQGENNQLWRLSYPSMQLAQLTEGVNSYADLSLTVDAQKGVASQVTLNSDIWVGLSRDPAGLKKITQASGSFSWAPDGRLVYSSTASGNRDLWIMQRDGSDQKQLTIDPGLDITPRVTPDNRYVVFISNRTGAFQVWRMNTDGSNQIQLTSGGPKNHISISVDGKWVFYNTTDDWHLWKISIDGGEPSKLAGYVASHAAVSPDQKLIASVGRTDQRRVILILPEVGGDPLKRFEIPGGFFVGYRVKWTPDGKALIYMASRGGQIVMFRQSLNGGQPQEIAQFNDDELFDFDYLDNGQLLAVTRGAWQHDVVLISGFGD